jgi:hypothetical protein
VHANPYPLKAHLGACEVYGEHYKGEELAIHGIMDYYLHYYPVNSTSRCGDKVYTPANITGEMDK